MLQTLLVIAAVFPWSLVLAPVLLWALSPWRCGLCLGSRRLPVAAGTLGGPEHVECERCRGWGYTRRRG